MRKVELDGHPPFYIEFDVRDREPAFFEQDIARFMRDHNLTKLVVYYGPDADTMVPQEDAEPVERRGLAARLGIQSKARRVQEEGEPDDGEGGSGGKSLLEEMSDESE